MTDEHRNDPVFPEDESNAPKADRGAPPIGKDGSNKLIAGAIFGLVAICGIGALIYNDMNKAVPEPLTKAEEVTFRIPNAPSSPQIIDEKPPEEELAKVTDQEESNQNDMLLKAQELEIQKMAMQLAQARREQQLIAEKEREARRQERLRSDQLVLDESGRGSPSSQTPATSTTTTGTNITRSGASEFEKDAMNASVVTVSASQMSNLDTLIPQGKMISGVLETAINSTLPGMTRAIVAENVYSFEGGNLLIPKGSHLIGSYQSAVQKGQNRIFIIWSRLIRPDGVSINIGSYGTDSLGRTGLSAAVDTHFLERFGSSILLSLIDTGTEIAGESLDDDDGTTIAVDTGDGFSKSSEIALENQINIQPTLHVNQGARIKVFVGKDLDFSSVESRSF